MLIASWLSWWYGRGWRYTIDRIYDLLLEVARSFSVMALLRTLFAPWKRIISYPGASLDAKLRAFADNLVSRMVGAAVRSLVLLVAVVIGILTLIGGFIWIVVWPLLPLGIIALVVKGIIG